MSVDDPAAVVENRVRHRRRRNIDVAITLLLLMVHVGLFAFTLFMVAMLTMITDACAYQACGDEAWLWRAMHLAFWGGGAILLADVVVMCIRFARARVAFFVPLLGCLAQIGLAVGAFAMESLAGPLNP